MPGRKSQRRSHPKRRGAQQVSRLRGSRAVKTEPGKHEAEEAAGRRRRQQWLEVIWKRSTDEKLRAEIERLGGRPSVIRATGLPKQSLSDILNAEKQSLLSFADAALIAQDGRFSLDWLAFDSPEMPLARDPAGSRPEKTFEVELRNRVLAIVSRSCGIDRAAERSDRKFDGDDFEQLDRMIPGGDLLIDLLVRTFSGRWADVQRTFPRAVGRALQRRGAR